MSNTDDAKMGTGNVIGEVDDIDKKHPKLLDSGL